MMFVVICYRSIWKLKQEISGTSVEAAIRAAPCWTHPTSGELLISWLWRTPKPSSLN